MVIPFVQNTIFVDKCYLYAFRDECMFRQKYERINWSSRSYFPRLLIIQFMMIIKNFLFRHLEVKWEINK